MRKSIVIPLGFVLLAGASYGGGHWWKVGRFIENTDNAYMQSDTSVMSPKIAGYVREVAVVDNQQVHAGDVLVRIDDIEFAARAAEAEANVAARQAAIVSIDSKITLQAALIEQADATIDMAKAEVARAQPDYERRKKLVAADFVARKDFDTAEADLRKAEAELVRAGAALTAERGQLVVLQASRKEAEAARKQAEAVLAVARNDLDNTIIRAPVDGVVGNKGVEVGQYVKAGTQLLAVVPLPNVYVVANFKETQLEHMRPGQPVEISIDAYPGQTLTGKVESFAPASGAEFSLLPPENATGNFTKVVQRIPVRIAVPTDNPLAGLLRPGLSVVVDVDTREPGNQPTLAGAIFGAAQAAPQTAANQ
jgi:membrane fusion protein (multidrug efflux system)